MSEIDQEFVDDFLTEAMDLILDAEDAFLRLDNDEFFDETINRIFRVAHNVKGSAAAVGLEDLAAYAHHFEELLTSIKSGKIPLTEEVSLFLLKCNDALKETVEGLTDDTNFKLDTTELVSKILSLLDGTSEAEKVPETEIGKEIEEDLDIKNLEEEMFLLDKKNSEKSNENTQVEEEGVLKIENVEKKVPKVAKKKQELIRIESAKLDELLNYVGELVVNQAILGNYNKRDRLDHKHAKNTIRYMDKLVADVRDISISLRMTPLKSVFQKMTRIVKELSITQSKSIGFELVGEEVELDKAVVEKIGDPLVHLIRNAVDHGIESKEERAAAGKPEKSIVRLSAAQQDDNVVVKVQDDGKGLSVDTIRNKAIEKGLISSSAKLSDQEIFSLIFQSGFSTRAQVTDVSGRGVGMDVVRSAIDELKGTIKIDSKEGKGTCFTIMLPLTLSIIQGMIVKVCDNNFIIPLAQLLETLDYRKLKIEQSTKSGRMINLRGEVIPVYSLESILSNKSKASKCSENKKGILTVFRGSKVSFEVDEIIGQQEVVIKKLGEEVNGIPGVFAGAILGNGDPGLILNLHDFLENRRQNVRAA